MKVAFIKFRRLHWAGHVIRKKKEKESPATKNE